jgi:hypothetical protein
MYRPLYMFGNNSNTSVGINYPLSAYYRYATYGAQQLPFIYVPNPNPFQIQAVTGTLKGVTFSPLFTLLPEYWYFTK